MSLERIDDGTSSVAQFVVSSYGQTSVVTIGTATQRNHREKAINKNKKVSYRKNGSHVRRCSRF